MLPTVLKYPAENPPVKAPWKRRLPSASVASCLCTGRAFVTARSVTFLRYPRCSSSCSRGVPTYTKSSESESMATYWEERPAPSRRRPPRVRPSGNPRSGGHHFFSLARF